MKKIILSSALLSGFMLVGTQLVSADEVKSAETPVGIEFKTDGATELVPGPYKGVLTLVYKPTAFEFGAHKATGALLTAEGKVKEGDKQWLVVNDDRDNVELGSGITDQDSKKGDTWKLTAKMAELKSDDEVLPSKLKLNLGDVKKYDLGEKLDGTGDYIPNPADDTAIVDFTEDIKHGVTNEKFVELESNTQKEVVVMSKNTADEKKVGVASEIKNTQLIMQAPTSSAGKQYTSKVIWTLSTGIK